MQLSRLSLMLATARLGTTLAIFPDNQAVIKGVDNATPETIRNVLLSNQVIGDVLDDFLPSYYLDIEYPHDVVMLGNDIPVKHVSHRPKFGLLRFEDSPTPKNSTFTIALTDPDAKSRENPKWSEMCHWIITNLTTPIPASVNIQRKKGGELKKYQPPGPPPKTGAHRYVFVLLEGNTTNIQAPKERQHWGYGKVRHGVRDWARDNNLTIVAANFFFAENKRQ